MRAREHVEQRDKSAFYLINKQASTFCMRICLEIAQQETSTTTLALFYLLIKDAYLYHVAFDLDIP